MRKPEVVPLFNGAGWAGYGVEPKRALKLTKRCVARFQGRKPRSPRRSSRNPRPARHVARPLARTTGSRGDPDEPEPEPVAHLRGFWPASARMDQHLERRRRKVAA
jgi:hypothetical protein